jgi:hypothetical protein
VRALPEKAVIPNFSNLCALAAKVCSKSLERPARLRDDTMDERLQTQKRAGFAAGAQNANGDQCHVHAPQRVAPVAGLAIALFATVAWIGLVGYTLIKLF